jgi:hypothetical protein
MSKLPKIRTEIHNGVTVPVNVGKTLEEIAETSIYDTSVEEYVGEMTHLKGKNNLQAAIATLIHDAANGDPDARKELLDRILGKAVQKQEIKSQNMTLVGFLDQISQTENEGDNGRTVDARQVSDPPAFA